MHNLPSYRRALPSIPPLSWGGIFWPMYSLGGRCVLDFRVDFFQFDSDLGPAHNISKPQPTHIQHTWPNNLRPILSLKKLLKTPHTGKTNNKMWGNDKREWCGHPRSDPQHSLNADHDVIRPEAEGHKGFDAINIPEKRTMRLKQSSGSEERTFIIY